MPIIRVLDLETNGMEATDGVIEAAYCDLTPDGDDWEIGRPVSEFFDIDVPLKPEARAIHHIRPQDIAGWPAFSAQAMIDQAVADGAIILAAHNFDFEGKWFTPELLGQLRRSAPGRPRSGSGPTRRRIPTAPCGIGWRTRG